MESQDLFAPKQETGRVDAPQKGLFVTNHLNLMYILAAGLVMPPAGFGDKHYADILGTFPGWIPLFVDSPSKAAIDLASSEAKHLKPVIVQFDLSKLSGRVHVMTANGVETRGFSAEFQGNERVILIPAPLPVSWIEFIAFRTMDDKKACEADSKDFGNVPLRDFTRKSKQVLFTNALPEPWPLSSGFAEQISVPLEQPLAAGGVMAMLQCFANLGDQAVHACQTAFDPGIGTSKPMEVHPILSGLGTWIGKGAATLPVQPNSAQDPTALQNACQARLFWEGVHRLIAWKEDGQRGSAEQLVLDHLAEAVEDPDEKSLGGVRSLKDALASLSGLADVTPSELFEWHGTPFAHAMILFFLCRDCSDLYNYESDWLVETDRLAAAVLCGVRDGWIDLPLRLRGDRAISDAICHRMAQMSHRLAGSGIDLGAAPPRVRPLREMFEDTGSWKARKKSAALELARIRKWDCVHTSINLRAGEYRLVVKGGTLSIEVPGEPKIVPEVDGERFLEFLAGVRLDSGTEAMVRKEIGS